ncbi:HWE histidine kinase domain-containing protein [Parerythrobacter aurantius]|uniref:HWE histidine kinase domain-containing protein n=1 Tax=Parerythrobacter aurantius TaxID=3127706 RepID=UPI00324C1651
MMEVDLTNCDREPIHQLGHIQSFGCLIVLSPDWLVLHASTNVEEHLGLAPQNMIGLPLRAFLSEGAMHEIRTQVQTLSSPDSVGRWYDLQALPQSERLFDLAVHRSGQSTIIELEPVVESGRRRDLLPQVRGMIERLKNSSDVANLCHEAARFMKVLNGFDRVMVYRFAEDETGEVISEAVGPQMEPFLGLRYPASDIPRQARALYKRSPIRIISNVDDELSPIVPEHGSDGQPIDLSLSTCRAVSPIHIEYLRNMNVAASMSVSIMDGDRLWGLFACHHQSPRRLNYAIRSACDLFGQMFGFLLSQIMTREAFQHLEGARGSHNALMRRLAEGKSLVEDFSVVVEELSTLIQFDGAIGWIDGHFCHQGFTPTKEETLPLLRFLNTTPTGAIYATDSIRQVYPPGADFVARAAGLMALPVSRSPRDYVVLFRREAARNVTWAGNPQKPVELGPNGVRLTPRKSFEAWTEKVAGFSEPWTVAERHAAEAIRVTLLEVVLRISDAANADRKRAQEKQELLVAELNHRVRNILNLIKGLIAQGKSETMSVADFTQVVGDRIHALARAHDLITSTTWEPASLSGMIQTEVAAYLGAKQGRVKLPDFDPIIHPDALSNLALVFHELTTNSAKYGALSDSTGRIDIATEQHEDGGVTIRWVESGGPVVKPPLRRGFGSTVIERSIPFELGGEAEITYPVTGVKARFFIPERFVASFVERGGSPAGSAPAADDPTPPPLANASFPGTALLVEDNLIIALDGEQFLGQLGANRVHVASTARRAMEVLAEEKIDYAVLDLNLGNETSLPVAAELAARRIPFTFATGYGEASALLAEFKDRPVLTKPYDMRALETALSQIMETN